MRGRKPKPIAMQIAEGDPRAHGKNKLKEALALEPKAQSGLPGCPRHFRGRSRSAWVFWARELEIMNLDRKPDGMMLEGACINYARAVEADIIIGKQGLIIEESVIDDKSGEKIVLKMKAHPAVSISRTAWMLTHKFCSEFGLSPVSRTRLKIEKRDDGEQDLAKLLSAPRTPKVVEVIVPSPAVN